MILPNPDKLSRFNKYALVILAAKRAKQLQEQGIARRALVKANSNNPLTIALEEIAAGRLIPSFNPEIPPELMEPATSDTRLTTDALAKVMQAVEANAQAADSRHEQAEAEAESGSGLDAEEMLIVDELDKLLGLDESDEDSDLAESEQEELPDQEDANSNS